MQSAKSDYSGRPHITLPDDMVIREAKRLHLSDPNGVIANRALRMVVENSAMAYRESNARTRTSKQFDYKRIAAGDAN